MNPDFSPFGPIPYGGEKGIGGAAAESGSAKPNEATVGPEAESGSPPKPKIAKRRNPLVKKITPNAIVRRIKLGQNVVSVCLDFFGEAGLECFFSEKPSSISTAIIGSSSGSLKTGIENDASPSLLTPEIAIMTETKSPRLAFTRQSKLLKDAFADFIEKPQEINDDSAPIGRQT